MVRLEPRRPEPEGFTAQNTSGFGPADLAALNRALGRLVAAGPTEHEGKVALDVAVRRGLEPIEAGEASVEWLLDPTRSGG